MFTAASLRRLRELCQFDIQSLNKEENVRHITYIVKLLCLICKRLKTKSQSLCKNIGIATLIQFPHS